MKKNNKKGFTLVELLAVIVILAVVVLIAMTAVVPQMNKARVEAFVTEANKYIQAATNYYTDSQLSGTGMASTGGCVKIATLNNGYIDKKDAKYKGYVNVTINTDGTTSYSILLDNGNFHTEKKDTNPKEYEISSGEIQADNVVAGTLTDTQIAVPSGCN